MEIKFKRVGSERAVGLCPFPYEGMGCTLPVNSDTADFTIFIKITNISWPEQ